MSDSLFSVQDQVVLVSGGSRGIGRAIAEGFAQRGARVVITGRDRAVLEQTAHHIAPPGATVRHMVCDVAKPADIDRLVPAVLAELGIDVSHARPASEGSGRGLKRGCGSERR